jgi:hypothetical protein
MSARSKSSSTPGRTRRTPTSTPVLLPSTGGRSRNRADAQKGARPERLLCRSRNLWMWRKSCQPADPSMCSAPVPCERHTPTNRNNDHGRDQGRRA